MNDKTQPPEKTAIELREMGEYFRPEPDFDNPNVEVVKLSPAADRKAHIQAIKSRKNAKYLADYAKKHSVEINDLISAVGEQVSILAAAVRGHKDYHDKYENPNDAEWRKIQQYDAINELSESNFPEITVLPNGGIDIDIDYNNFDLAREWNNGELKPIIDTLEKHLNALAAGDMVVLYEQKTAKYSYYQHENHLADTLQYRESRAK